MNNGNRYGKPFYSAIDYQILFLPTHTAKEIIGYNADGTPIEGDRYVTTTNTRKLFYKSPSPCELIDNIKNLKTWGLNVDVAQDIVFGKDGVLIFWVDKMFETVEQLASKYSYVQQLLDKGFELKIGAGISEKNLYPGYEEYDTHVALPRTKSGEPNKNGLYCTNYKKFEVTLEDIKYTENANIIRDACSLVPIDDSRQVEDDSKICGNKKRNLKKQK